MTRFSYIHIAAALAMLALVACDLEKPSERMLQEGSSADRRASQATRGDQEPVAIVNGEVVTLDEFQRRIEQLAPFARARLSSLDKRKDFLDSVVQFEVLADEAEERGYGDDPAVIQAMKDVMVRRMIQEEVRKRVSMSDITSEQVEDYYREHRSDYRNHAARRALLLIVDSEDEAREIRRDLLENRPDDSDQRVLEFRKIAAQISTDRVAAGEGGDVGWIDHPDARPERIKLSREIFALEARGDITEPFRLRDRWALASFFKERSATKKRLEDVRESIRETLYEEQKKKVRDDFVAELRESARIETHPDILESVETPTSDAQPTIKDIPTVPIRDLRGERGASQPDQPNQTQD